MKTWTHYALITSIAIGFVLPIGGVHGSDDAEQDEIFELSPFVVDASGDLGYMARNTLAGSRMNTQLRDTAASISIFTQEMLNDIGATDVKDALRYGTNAVSDVGDTERNLTGNSVVEFDFRFRMRGLPASYARNYFTWEMNSDYFNIERFEESRGPNSILFGIGSAGGIINASTKRAQLERFFNRLVLQTSSFDHYRAAGDFNMVIRPNQFALRLNLVHDERKSWREFEFKRQDRTHLAGTWRISRNVTFRFEGETGKVKDNVARPWGMLDFASTWMEAGRPTSARLLNDINLGIGRVNIRNPQMTFVENSGTLMNWQGRMVSNTPNGVRWTLFEDESIIPNRANPAGPGAIREFDANTFSFYLDNRIMENWFVELAFNRQISGFHGYESANSAHQLYGDPNEELPNREPNPFAGRLYVETNWFERSRDVVNDYYRLTSSYNLDTERLGEHRFAFMYQRNNRDYQRSESREYLLDNPFDMPTADNIANLLFRRYYFDEGSVSDIRAPEWRGLAIDGLVDPVSGRSFTSGFRQRNQNIDDDREKMDTFLIGSQSYLMNRKLVATLGFRRDVLRIIDRGVKRDEEGYFAVDYENVLRDRIPVHTYTLGVVGHPMPWLSVFYNRSQNANLPNSNIRILPHSSRGDPPDGVGQDAGVMMDLWEGRFFVRLNYFTSDVVGELDFSNVQNIVTERNDRVLDALVDYALLSFEDAEQRRVNVNGHTTDQQSKGWELELTGNPTNNWRISASFSITEVVRTNIMPEVKRWRDENISYWEGLVAGSQLGLEPDEIDVDTNVTLADEIENLIAGVRNATALEGTLAEGQRKHKANLFTRYTFRDGLLDGAFVGGGVRYLGSAVIGMSLDDRVLKGNGQTQFDLLFGYGQRLARRGSRFEVQLNIMNVLNETRPLVLRRETFYDTLNVVRVNFQEPRTYRLTVRVDF